MFQGTAANILLAALLALSVAFLNVLPPPVAGAESVQITCSSLNPDFCSMVCSHGLVKEKCCSCHGICCSAEDGALKLKSDEIPGALEDGRDSDDSDGLGKSEDPVKPNVRETEDKATDARPPEQLILAPKCE